MTALTGIFTSFSWVAVRDIGYSLIQLFDVEDDIEALVNKSVFLPAGLVPTEAVPLEKHIF